MKTDREAAAPRTIEATREVDESLLDWYRELSVTERLRSASKSAATMERLRRAADRDQAIDRTRA